MHVTYFYYCYFFFIRPRIILFLPGSLIFFFSSVLLAVSFLFSFLHTYVYTPNAILMLDSTISLELVARANRHVSVIYCQYFQPFYGINYFIEPVRHACILCITAVQNVCVHTLRI